MSLVMKWFPSERETGVGGALPRYSAIYSAALSTSSVCAKSELDQSAVQCEVNSYPFKLPTTSTSATLPH